MLLKLLSVRQSFFPNLCLFELKISSYFASFSYARLGEKLIIQNVVFVKAFKMFLLFPSFQIIIKLSCSVVVYSLERKN